MLKNKFSENKLKFSDIDSDFIPYAAHFSEDTLITKSGNLMQVIKITGFAYEVYEKKHLSIRASIRAAIKNHINNDSFAIWTHTIRRRKDLSLKGEYSNSFCDSLDKGWNGLHDWSEKYVNELFITIITEPKYYKFTNFTDILKTVNYSILKISENKYLDEKHQELNKITENFLAELKDFGAKRLTIFKYEDQYYSEILRFLSKIINLEDKEIPVRPSDISEYLPYCKIVFADNSLEVLDEDRKHFAAILSIKEYSELSLNSLDRFLLMPLEFIVSQSLDFVNADLTLDNYKFQKEITDLGGDKEFLNNSELSKLFSEDNSKSTSFGEQQLTIMLLADDINSLEKNISRACDILYSYGLVIYREDIAMENCFWSQLPGNFYYISRRKPINTSSYAGLASLSNFPAGKAYGNKWGDAVTCFYTHNKTPYFFNFHLGDNGHSMIIGPYGHGKTVLLNFLIAQAQKFQPRIIYIDYSNSSEIFVNAIGGKYHKILLNGDSELFSPIKTLRKYPDILENFLKFLIIQKKDITDNKFQQAADKQQIIAQIINDISQGKHNKLSDLSNYFNDASCKKIYDVWHSSGVFNNVFDNETDVLSKSKIVGFDLSQIVNFSNILVPITYYIMKYLEKTLDGTPTILVIDESFKLLDNPFLAGDLHRYFASLKNNNAICILASESVADATKSSITKLLINEVPTQFFLPQNRIGLEFQNIFKLTKEEVNLLSTIKKDERHVLLKHGEDAIIVETDMGLLEDLMMVLSTTDTGLKIMNKIKERTGEKPELWLPMFREIVDELLNEDEDYVIEEEEEEEYNYENAARKEEQNRVAKKIGSLREERLRVKKT